MGWERSNGHCSEFTLEPWLHQLPKGAQTDILSVARGHTDAWAAWLVDVNGMKVARIMVFGIGLSVMLGSVASGVEASL
jgi:hypothetical protein